MSYPPPLRLAPLALLLIVAACDGGGRTPAGPSAQAGLDAASSLAQAAAPQETPFYWYKDRKIFLDVVPGEFVVKSSAPDPARAGREALAGLGLDAQMGRRLIRGHRILEVPGANSRNAREVARRLLNHPEISFASPNYVVQSDGGPFEPLETLMVKFRDGVSRSEIEALNAQFGVSVVREPEPGNPHQYHHLKYPETGDLGVLEIAAAYDRSPLTNWADPTRLVRVEFHGNGENQEFFNDQWYLQQNNNQFRDGVPVDINVVPAWDNNFKESPGCDPLDPNCERVGALNPVENDFHGTAVAGIIAARHQSTNTGIAGIAPGVTLFSVRVGEFPSNLTSNDSLAAAIDAAIFAPPAPG